jgi:hypothetical protein
VLAIYHAHREAIYTERGSLQFEIMEFADRINRLNDFFGDKMLAEVTRRVAGGMRKPAVGQEGPLGAASMFSIPPAMAVSTEPTRISCAAERIACAPEPQTRFTVMAGTWTGRPPWIAACRAGFILLPACTVFPKTAMPISSGRRPDRRRAALITDAPSSTAGISFNVPPNVPRLCERFSNHYRVLRFHGKTSAEMTRRKSACKHNCCARDDFGRALLAIALIPVWNIWRERALKCLSLLTKSWPSTECKLVRYSGANATRILSGHRRLSASNGDNHARQTHQSSLTPARRSTCLNDFTWSRAARYLRTTRSTRSRRADAAR